ncbi:DNA cytosine methyltransferase [Magnetospirillum sp. 15-1]|uniref:DNA cytosine methyltransferase n=1 Tax=Magnetospirillum sp. 15-1 TaxID=1979370 RepID=UPI0011443079|nr:DNA cytosine methyltransferase [Magnetospirillum sp. 15-1]
MRKLRAIDLYSGVGGWSLGLRLAGIDVIASYEYWGPANETNFKNNSHQAQTVDIRRLSFEDLPTDIDVVVGSPPCTQFSFSNRGGGGDIADGLEDIKRFLAIVDHLKPRVWAMENVPRVAKIIEAELEEGGKLDAFRHLGCVTHIVDMAEYGLPQRRRRCIAGNFDIDLLEDYRAAAQPRTLGEIVAALSSDPIVDPLFGLSIPRSDLTDHVAEDALSEEEVRINCANKTTHTVYNAMPFPDPLDRSVRTITATCTRVSRESIVIQAAEPEGAFRRLTLRERASLQGFPVTFQFYGANYGQKLRMIGNAVPPAFSYLMGHVLQGHCSRAVPSLSMAAQGLTRPKPLPLETPPDRVGASYPASRTFKFAIPSLQLKSGVRFEICNDTSRPVVEWRLAFFFGTSKAIKSLRLDAALAKCLSAQMPEALAIAVEPILSKACSFIAKADIANMQALWAHRGPGGTRAFMLLDMLDEVGTALVEAISAHQGQACKLIDFALVAEYGDATSGLPGVAKLHRNAALILSGLLLGSVVNPLLADRGRAAVRTKRDACALRPGELAFSSSI